MRRPEMARRIRENRISMRRRSDRRDAGSCPFARSCLVPAARPPCAHSSAPSAYFSGFNLLIERGPGQEYTDRTRSCRQRSLPLARARRDPPFSADMIPAQSSTLATASARAEVLRLLDRMTGTLARWKHPSTACTCTACPSRSAPSPLSRPPRCRSSPRAPSCCWSATKPTSTTLPLPDLVGGPAGGRQGVGGQPRAGPTWGCGWTCIPRPSPRSSATRTCRPRRRPTPRAR